MRLFETAIDAPISITQSDLLTRLAAAVSGGLAPGQIPIRFAVTESDDTHIHCEIGIAEGEGLEDSESIFRFEHRPVESANAFVLLSSSE